MLSRLIVVPFPTWRFGLGLFVSLAIHTAVILAIKPAPSRQVPTPPFFVELLREAVAESPSQVSAPAGSEIAVSQASAATQPRSEIRAISLPDAPNRQTTDAGEQEARSFMPQGDEIPDRYFTVREVDVRPEQINEVDLVYPARAYVLRIKGKVRVRIFISDEGAVDEVTILDAAPSGVFEEATLQAVLALKFKPAFKQSRPVRSEKTIEVTFDPYERINVP